uniref:aminotransferase class V-fold PLP-dependent enzyme n=1 Tax=Bacillus altitudinis TaxID=293387 RepID=UPI00119FA584|nr:aminotransferase class V-fold PLP-dependent enzyme [Bacillus altitudinis]
MDVNNERGGIQRIEEGGRMIRKYGKEGIFDVDGVEGIGKVGVGKEMDIDVLRMSGEKIEGLKGRGALFLKKEMVVGRFMRGGEEEVGVG